MPDEWFSMNKNNNTRSGHELSAVFCCTPFQAVLLNQVLEHEAVTRFHLVYMSLRDSEENYYYFHELAKRAEEAQFIGVRRMKFDIFTHVASYLDINQKFRSSRYDKIILSSFDKLALRRFVAKHPDSQIVTFDDGSGNVNLQSSLVFRRNPRREDIYATICGAPTHQSFINIVTKHYSIYPMFTNIMPIDLIKFVDLFSAPAHFGVAAPEISLFIGQPIEGASKIRKMKEYISTIRPDYYVLHPREESPLVDGIALLEKKGKIAEEAIFELSRDRQLTVIGGFSSVLLNVSTRLAKKVMVLDGRDSTDRYLATLGEKAGCEIVFL